MKNKLTWQGTVVHCMSAAYRLVSCLHSIGHQPVRLSTLCRSHSNADNLISRTKNKHISEIELKHVAIMHNDNNISYITELLRFIHSGRPKQASIQQNYFLQRIPLMTVINQSKSIYSHFNYIFNYFAMK